MVLKGRIGGKGRYLQVVGGPRTFSQLRVYHDHDHDFLISFVFCFFSLPLACGEQASGEWWVKSDIRACMHGVVSNSEEFLFEVSVICELNTT